MNLSLRPSVPVRRSPVGLAVGGLALAVVLTACGGSEQADVAGDPAPASEPSATEPPAPAEPAEPADEGESDDGASSDAPPAEPEVVVPEVLDFQATTVSGDAFDGASVAGRPVVLWFWAPWCAVCRSQVPTVTELTDTYGEDVAFVGVGGLDGTDAIRAFADEVPGLTHLSDPDGELYQRFGISEQSSFVVLDEAGGEALRTGYSDDDALSGVVADLAG